MAVNRKYGFRGKYCTHCNTVWEMFVSQGTAGYEIKHHDFPSYGLERQDCSTCAKASPEETPDTLVQKIATEHQKLFMKNVKKQSK